MMIVARSMGYDTLLEEVRDKRTAVWACATCARICGITGEGPVRTLVESLESDGVEVVSVQTIRASCLADLIIERSDTDALRAADVVVALTCDVGAETLSELIPGTVINPIVTLGQGARRTDGTLTVTHVYVDGVGRDATIHDACQILGLYEGPFTA